MARTKATVRRLNRPMFVAVPGQKIGNKNIMNRRQSMFKIKTLLPQHKQIEVKKIGRIVRRMTVRRKSQISLEIEGLDFNQKTTFTSYIPILCLLCHI